MVQIERLSINLRVKHSQLKLSLRIPHIHALSLEIWIYENLEKRGLTSQVCHAHLNFIGIMCSKFNLDDLESVGEV